MRKYFLLTRKLFKSGLGGFGGSGKKKKFRVGNTLLMAFLFICLLPLLGVLFRLGGEAYEAMAVIGQEGLVLSMAFFAASILSLVLGFPMLVSVFYMTGDIERLMYLPVKPWQIVGAKFTISLIFTYLTSFYFLLPLLTGYGIAAGAGSSFWIMALLALLLLPVIPLVYCGIFSMIIMRVFKRAKNKDFITIISVVLSLCLAFGLSSLGNLNLEGGALQELLLKGGNSLMGLMNGIFPALRFLEEAVAEGSILSLLLFLAVTVVSVVVFFLIAEQIYFAGAMGMRETKAGRKKLSEGESRRLSRRKSAGGACFWKEIRLLVRSPIYFMNCVMMVFLWPLFVLIPVAIQMAQNQELKIGEIIGQVYLGDTGGAAITLFVVFCISLGAGIFNYVAGTAISREGKSLYMMKIIPVPLKVQLRAKLLTAVCFGMAGTTLYCMIFLVVSVFLFSLPVWTLPIALVGSALANGFQCTIQLFVDLFHPKLTWESEQQAVKQNFTVILAMLLNMAVGAGLGFLVFLLYDVFSLPLPAYAGAVCLVLGACVFVIYKLVMAYGVKRIAEYE
jgi:ABC-2 type transport system permease protein